MKKNNSLVQLLFLSLLWFACKKDKQTDPPTPPAEGTREQLTTDSLYLYAKQIYLWYDAIPAIDVFKPRQYATGGNVLSNYQRELYAITQFKTNPTTGEAYEYSGIPGHPKYSFITEESLSGGRQGAIDLSDKGEDLGLGLSASGNEVRIRIVYPASPAANAGLTRGMKVNAINGTTVNSSSGAFIENALNGSNVTMTVEKTAGVPQQVSLTKAKYTSSAVLKTATLNAGTQKVGYIAYGRFSLFSVTKAAIDQAFAKFVTDGVTSLIVDLRYNGGGYTESAEYLVNQIAPNSLDGKVMYVEYFNDLLQKGQAPILKEQLYRNAAGETVMWNGHLATYADLDYSVSGNTFKFTSDGSLNSVKQVVFIVSGNTASASELVINSLKPYMPVKLVGATTYGKPVGFFGIKIDKYTVYMSNFYMQNANGNGDYFHGMDVDIPAEDDVRHDFGDPEETGVMSALNYIEGHPAGKVGRVIPVVHMGPVSFNGMIETRLKLR
ncbi:S41 family peptidase [Chitinophaga filiformis]|uniref:Peptidase family S41 n=1 Tax=Chitinophaga filiformis TaxID=104663 RepID=A0A1G7H9M8_CHIFI|nr:S41 family peptidase [Chitinophaga filiformis]SDE97167.1 Peptidase family S41 [Chitinophaga filiformis]